MEGKKEYTNKEIKEMEEDAKTDALGRALQKQETLNKVCKLKPKHEVFVTRDAEISRFPFL